VIVRFERREDMRRYLELRCRWPSELEDELSSALATGPVLGAELGPEENGLVQLSVFMSGDRDAEARLLGQALIGSGARDLEIGERLGRDWLADYRAAATPFPVGRRWWIDPHPEQPSPAPRGRIRLAVVPRSAFGSGSHESTQLVLGFLEELELEDRRVLDVGTGSGILAVAAASLGARLVVGFDIDPAAAVVARDTVSQQDRDRSVVLFVGEIEAVARSGFDLVVCNMISSRLLPLLPRLRETLATPGRIVLAGFLDREGETVSRTVAASGFTIECLRTANEWSGLTAVTRGR
jgi:ribosomal protein L11 methyltransferase